MPQQSEERKKIVEILEVRRGMCKDARKNWDSHWDDVAYLVDPTRQFTTKFEPGERRRQRIYDSTAPDAHDSLAAATHGLLTNPAIRWFELAVQALDGGIDDSITEEERAWLYDVSTMCLMVFNSPSSGFATSSFELYLDEVAFGHGVMLVRDRPHRISFQARDLSSFWMLDDDEGKITDQFADFEMTADEIANRWPLTMSDDVRKKADDPKKSRERMKVVHTVRKRRIRDLTRMDQLNKPWESVYYEETSKQLLAVGGFDENPYLTPRWSRAPQETYGRSPAMKMLPLIKVVNEQAKQNLTAGALATNPPILTPSNAIEGSMVIRPGGMIPYKAGSRDAPRAMDHGARPDTGAVLLEANQLKIEKAFFLDVFRLPDRDRMTATEIIERRQQGLLKASPILSRQYQEWIGPVVDRVYRHLLRRNMLPPAPPSLAQRTLTVEYVSPMAQSQRASEVQSFTSAMIAATPLLQGDPTLMQTDVDGAESLRQIFSMHNVNPRFLRRRPEAKRLRDQLMQQQQQAAAAQTAAAGATAVRDTAAGISDLGGLAG